MSAFRGWSGFADNHDAEAGERYIVSTVTIAPGE